MCNLSFPCTARFNSPVAPTSRFCVGRRVKEKGIGATPRILNEQR